jgi:hypothetical protein
MDDVNADDAMFKIEFRDYEIAYIRMLAVLYITTSLGPI